MGVWVYECMGACLPTTQVVQAMGSGLERLTVARFKEIAALWLKALWPSLLSVIGCMGVWVYGCVRGCVRVCV